MDFPAEVRNCPFLEDGVEEAARFYVSLLPDGAIDAVQRMDPQGRPFVVEFTLAGAPPDPAPAGRPGEHLDAV